MKVLIDTLKQEKGLIIGFCISATLFMAIMIYMYPGDEAAVEQLTGLEDMGDWDAAFGIKYGEGGEYRLWLAMLGFSYIAMIYVAIPALVGTAVISSDIDRNTLDLLMGNPISKRKVLLEKALAVLLICFISSVYLFVVVDLFSWTINQELTQGILFVACLQLFVLMVFVSFLSIFFAIKFHDLGRARRYIGIIVIGSFIISMIVMFSEELEFLKYIQIFYYSDSAANLLKPSLQDVLWDKTVYLLIFSIVLFVITFYLNDNSNLFPNYSHEIKEKEGRKRGIPLLFFYLGKFQGRYPALVEQIQSDRLLIYIFGGILFTSGIITPGMYPGDESWPALSGVYGGNLLMDALLREHGVALNFMGYIATEGFGEFYLYLGLFVMILAPKIVLRDQKKNTADLLLAQPISLDNLLFQRTMAVVLEFITLSLVSLTAYLLGIITSGYDIEHISAIAKGLFVTFLVCLFMTSLIIMVITFMKKPTGATGISALLFYGTLVLFMVSYDNDQTKFISTLTPFYWVDRTAILYDNTFQFLDILAIIGYLVSIIVFHMISRRQIINREFYI